LSALLEVRGVSRSFGGVRALDDVSLDVVEGSIVGLIGPNGAGKTTLFNTISGLTAVDAGTIEFAGTDITRLPAHRRAALGIGRSFQNLGLMQDETVTDNVLAALHRSAPYSALDAVVRPWRRWSGERRLARRAGAALARLGMSGERDLLVSDLSFAKARFAELAAVIAEDPALMLLDEPTTGLDVAEVATLCAVLGDIRASGTTMLVVAHDVGFVMRMCDHVYVLAEGRLLFEGEPAAVQAEPTVVEAYLGAPT
jgi:branched-chain amino acid transport system ATP-binding protein